VFHQNRNRTGFGRFPHRNNAKLYEEKGDFELANEYYEKFINIWQDADDDISILIDYRKRFENLKAS